MENYLKIKSNMDITYFCRYYVVWCVKYKRKVLINDIGARLKELIEQSCSEMEIELLEIQINPNHVQLLIDVAPQNGIHKAIKRIKGYTAGTLRNEYKELRTKLPTLWSNSYYLYTLGRMELESMTEHLSEYDNLELLDLIGQFVGVKEYIDRQKTSQRNN